jgi:hypothetical protein
VGQLPRGGAHREVQVGGAAAGKIEQPVDDDLDPGLRGQRLQQHRVRPERRHRELVAGPHPLGEGGGGEHRRGQLVPGH